VQYAGRLREYGFDNVGILRDVEEEDLTTALDELRLKRPHACSLLKAHRALVGDSTRRNLPQAGAAPRNRPNYKYGHEADRKYAEILHQYADAGHEAVSWKERNKQSYKRDEDSNHVRNADTKHGRDTRHVDAISPNSLVDVSMKPVGPHHHAAVDRSLAGNKTATLPTCLARGCKTAVNVAYFSGKPISPHPLHPLLLTPPPLPHPHPPPPPPSPRQTNRRV
jgi:hypothetical protein